MAALTTTRPALLRDGSDAAFRAMVHDTLAFAARIEEVRRRFGERIGLSGAAYTLLITVLHLQGAAGVAVSAVAEHLHVSGSAVTIEAGRLVKLDLLEKGADAADRRRVLLRATARAERLLASLAPVQVEANDALFACLDAPGFERFAAAMRALVGCADDALALLDATAARRAAAAG
jgi:MarR family transcriptional regulator, organic hydroperoxide resistance regulator